MKDVIEKMGMLARLKVADKEVSVYAEKFKRILEYVETLKKVNVEGLEATSHATDVAEAFREDIVKAYPNTNDLVEAAPQHDEQSFIVPKVIE